jgi:hypothetical protein
MILIHVSSNIVQLPVVDLKGSYSHGYIGAEGKKEDTYYNQGCLSQILNMICSNSAALVIRPGVLSTLCTYCDNWSVTLMPHLNAICKSFGIQCKPTRVLINKPRSESYARDQHHIAMVMLDLLTYNGPVSSFWWECVSLTPPLHHSLKHLLFSTQTCHMKRSN